MTREEASFILANIDRRVCDDELSEALDMAIKALEQEQQSEWERDHEVLKAYADGQESMKPCKDAISRQAVLDKLKRLIEVEHLQGTDEMGYGRERVNAYEMMIHNIESEYLYPPVSVAEKVGKWKHFAWSDDCSECGWSTGKYGSPTKYCPNCGARMKFERR